MLRLLFLFFAAFALQAQVSVRLDQADHHLLDQKGALQNALFGAVRASLGKAVEESGSASADLLFSLDTGGYTHTVALNLMRVKGKDVPEEQQRIDMIGCLDCPTPTVKDVEDMVYSSIEENKAKIRALLEQQ